MSGYVKDYSNGEELIGVTVFIKELGTGTISNHYGFYSVTLPQGSYNLVFSYVGFQTKPVQIDLNADLELNQELITDATLLQDIVIVGEEEDQDVNVQGTRMSANNLNIEQIKKLPALFGEPDIIKNVQMQPGVVAVGEGTSGYFVRGGTPDQNLILIDEAPIFDPSHFFGLFSIFNADVIKDTELIKGGIPARYGGRLSSILDIRTKDGNTKKLAGSAGLGLLSSKLMLEGPIVKEKSSFLLSGRRSYIDLFLKGNEDVSKVYFYDVNAKVNWKANNKNRFFLSTYLGRDVQQFNDDGAFDWGNKTASLRWNHLFNDRIFSNTSLIFSRFDYGLEIFDEIEGLEWTAGITQASFKEDFTYFINPQNELTFGYEGTYRNFSPGKVVPNSENSIFKRTELEKNSSFDHALYLGNKQAITNKLTLEYGLRYTIFQNIGPSTIYEYEDPLDNVNINRIDSTAYGSFETIKTFQNFEPRFSTRYLINNTSSVKASYNRMVQNVHLLSNSVVSLPFNTWAPSGPYIDPQKSDQYAIGYFRNLRDNAYELSGEVYYKRSFDLTAFADNANVFFNEDLAVEFRNGTSRAYGLELYGRKNVGRLTGFVSYTLSKATQKIPGINLDRRFPASHDRRNNLAINATFKLSDRVTFGGNFVYGTGRPFTLPVGRYEIENYNLNFYTGRNQYRLPDFHRLDLSASIRPKKNLGKKWRSSWTFAIYNAYNRKNPFTIYTRKRQTDDGDIIGDGSELEARLVYLFPILPSITYNVTF